MKIRGKRLINVLGGVRKEFVMKMSTKKMDFGVKKTATREEKM